ncbi:anaphase-promoting complex subunit 7-like [Pollicipes pollicipes]|uniref:anaphase-promoting complex subunit 7-like n=1 Tax=Pollicipes pollicipes TaxID=41117 RepID=UPI0018858ACD|nr:anaphase-promoting complex subunit 7-like [Pollicipes pollicipes]
MNKSCTPMLSSWYVWHYPHPWLIKGTAYLPVHKYQTLVYSANSLFQLRDIKRAEAFYKKALQYRKSLAKVKGKQLEFPKDCTSEIDVKYQLHLCYVHQKQFFQATGILESVPAKQRTVKVNMALGQLYQQCGTERPAITAYKEVLRECPLAMEAAQGLLQMGVKGTEVACLMVNGTSNVPNMEWVSLWLRAHAHLNAQEYVPCAHTLKQLEERSPLQENAHMLVTLGRAFYYSGDHRNALSTLQRVHLVDPLLASGMDLLADMYHRDRKSKELEQLANQLMSSSSEVHPEPWVAMAYHTMLNKRPQRALYFAHKASVLAPRNVEALVLKGNLLLELKKTQEAVIHFREAMQIASYRYEPVHGLVQCYVYLNRCKEAIALANNACKEMGYTARALTLYASVMLKEPLYVSRVRSCLEKALDKEPSYLPAVHLLVEIYEKSNLHELAIDLLRRQVATHSTCRLHLALADLLVRDRDEERALHHYQIALNLEPTNERALRSLRRLEAGPDQLEPSYELDPEEAAESENDEAVEDTDSELGQNWAEMDLTFGSQ